MSRNGNGSDDLSPEFAAQCDKADVSRLAALSSFEYGRVRAAEAKRFNLSVEWLDKARAEAQKKAAAETPPPMPERWQLEPWGEPVDGADLLDDLRTTFEQYVVLPEHGSVTMALWVAHTWAIDAAFVSAFLMFNSPEMRCGKSTALGLVKRVARRAVMASNISPSAVFRYIDAQQPTLAIDEAETFFTDNEEMRGILNSGHTRDTASVIRLVGEDHEAKEFSTWGPKAIASIGKLAATLRDRAIIIPMQRKGPGDRVEKLRAREDNDTFLVLRRKAMRWAADNVETLKAAQPRIPEELNDRAADNWEPLLAIAELAGCDWPEAARQAARALNGASEADSQSIRVELLADIRQVFAKLKVDRIFSATLVTELVSDEEGRWASYGEAGRPIKARQVARLLSDFGIRPQALRGEKVLKGYLRESFTDAFTRYLPDPPILSVTPKQTNDINRLHEKRSVTNEMAVTDRNQHKPLKNNECYGVTDRNPPPRGEGPKCAQCNAHDGTERPYTIDGSEVWLHTECKHFWLVTEGREQRW
jgi:putative DNA primase/helicase